MYLWVVFLGLLSVLPVWADPATHRLPNMQRQLQMWMGDHSGAHVRAGCLPTVPSSGLVLAAFACEAYAADTPSGELLYIDQPAQTVTIQAVTGVHWLAVHRDTSTAVSGWVRVPNTRYLSQVAASQPVDPPGGLLVARLTVAGGDITTVADFRKPLSYVQQGVFDPSDRLYGARGDGITDATAAVQAAENGRSAQTIGGTLQFRNGSFALYAPILLKSGGTITGQGQAKTILLAFNEAGNTFDTQGVVGFPARFTFRDMSLAGATVKTGGSAILATTPPPYGDLAQQQLLIQNIWCMHHYTCFFLQNSIFAHITDNMLEDIRGIGIIVDTRSNPDAGDNIIAHNVLAGGSAARLLSIHSGGQRVTGNKFLAGGMGIYIAPSSTTIALIDVLIANNSIENQTTYGILAETPDVGSRIGALHIVGNQLATFPGGTTAAHIGVSGVVGPLIIANNIASVITPGAKGIFVDANVRSEAPSGFVISGNLIDGSSAATSGGIEVPDVAGSFRGTVSGNYITGLAIRYKGPSALFSGDKVTAAELPLFGDVGSTMYCTDCQVTSVLDNTCIAGGSGAHVIWTGAGNVRRCFANQN
jgi:hypothetical protein